MPTTSAISFGLGLLLLAIGIIGFVRERRRLSNIVFGLFGVGFSLLGLILTTDDGRGASLWVVIVLAAIILTPTLGYPVLTLFLLANGLTMIRKERRTPGNLLSLLVGIGLVSLPIALVGIGTFEDKGYLDPSLGSGLVLFLYGAALYFAFCFLIFLLAALAYRRVPSDLRANYVIVLGSGLIGTRVPPLLASRLDKGIEVANAQNPPATIIPSGGQGPGEEIAEGTAMARYLGEHGIGESRILVEDRARNTRENLIFSQELLPEPTTRVLVVTNTYHVFRAAMLTRDLGLDAKVVGSRTARYYVPSAFLREFAAVMKEYLRLNVVMMGVWTLMVLALIGVSHL